jgi:hypothetical protein
MSKFKKMLDNRTANKIAVAGLFILLSPRLHHMVAPCISNLLNQTIEESSIPDTWITCENAKARYYDTGMLAVKKG